jgi:uncharacterized protein (DUF488 family)
MLVRLGYGGHSIETWSEALTALKPDLVIDARYKPWSRRPGFSGSQLKTLTESLGYPYQHWKDLGNTAYKTGGVDVDPRAIKRVGELAKDVKVVIVCACRDDNPRCHTQHILDTATDNETTDEVAQKE